MKEHLIALIKQIEEHEPETFKGRLSWSIGVRAGQVAIVGNREAIFRLGCELVKASALNDKRIDELIQFFDDFSKVKDVLIVVKSDETFRRDPTRANPSARERIWRAIARAFRNGRA